MRTRKTRFAFLTCLLAIASNWGLANAQAPAAMLQSSSAATAPPQDLDAAAIVTLRPGARFQISIPLRPSKAVNLGAARLDVTLQPSGKGKQTGPDLHLVAVLPVAQAALSAGTASVTLHGVVPDFPPTRNGLFHPSDYSIHLGSGNVTNIGTPDDTLIDTESLTKKLQDLHIRLEASNGSH